MFSLILATLGTRESELKRLLNSLLLQNNVKLELIVIAQGNFEIIRKILNEYTDQLDIRLIKTNEIGLSKARNLGLKHVQGENIVVFTDDDCWYPQNIFETIRTKVRRSQISTFQIFDPKRNELFKNYPIDQARHKSIFKSFKVSSIEIFINTEKVDIKELSFDEEFGLGAKYPSGEENTLLLDLMKKGNSITYYPEVVVFHKVTEKVFNHNDLYVKGAFFRRNFNVFASVLLGTGFFVRKLHLVDRKIDSFTAILKGSLSYSKK
ncbi:glycosyltransferase family A protein [Sporosarcina sp.]|uniref:glycosyltransferase family A protein n=1 Tax=Sporosarcina sp. TaxID=49982 RepID=UPI00261DC654|nr:glycosyltransferase family A protein [Sporosarcina sp.]